MKYDLYIVGGFVRDTLMGVPSSDFDYTVVITSDVSSKTEIEIYNDFVKSLEDDGYKIFLKTPDKFTVRAKKENGPAGKNKTYDFVISRKESGFIKGTRSPKFIGIGSLQDDLERRDFSCNCMAMKVMSDGTFGEVIDLFNGANDIKEKTLRTPISPEVSINDDPLRILRALRFCCTKDFIMDGRLVHEIKSFNVFRFVETVSKERVYDELMKMFKFNTVSALEHLDALKYMNKDLYDYIFLESGVRLIPSLKDEGK